MKTFLYPPQTSNVSVPPIQFELDGVATTVSKDTVTPANSDGLPVEVLNFPATQPISGSVSVSNFPASQPISGSVTISNFPATQAISAASLPLPSGAATEAKQDSAITKLTSIDTKLSAPISTSISAALPAGNNNIGDVDIASLPVSFGAGNSDATTTRVVIATNQLAVAVKNTSTPLMSELYNEVVGGNTSEVTLAGGGNFTGTWRELWKFGGLQVGVYSNVDSATDGFKVEFSYDGLAVHHTHTYTFKASSNGIGYIFAPEFKFFRINYTNGAAAQTDFKLISTLKPTALFPSQYRLSTPMYDETQVLLTKSVISGKTTGGGGGYVDVKVNPSGALVTESTISGTVTTSVTGTVTTSEATKSGTITQIQATVGLTAVRATVAGTAPSASRKKLMIKPSKNNTGSIYLGASTVTTGTGMEIIGPDRLEFVLDSADYYLISDTAAQVVEIIEVV